MELNKTNKRAETQRIIPLCFSSFVYGNKLVAELVLYKTENLSSLMLGKTSL